MIMTNNHLTHDQSISLEQLMAELKSSTNGLSHLEAIERQKIYGKNQIVNKKTNPIVKFLKFFVGPIPFMIEAAAILSLIAKHWPDFFSILALLIINTIVGFTEEKQASDAIESLKKQLSQVSKAKRDGIWQDIETSELVPGDIIHLKLGDIVPADARLITGNNLQVDQSSLTGESLPVSINKGDQVNSSSIISSGYGDALVYSTGKNTYFGKTTELIKSVNQSSHFQKAIVKIGNYLIVLALAMIILINIFSFFRHTPPA